MSLWSRSPNTEPTITREKPGVVELGGAGVGAGVLKRRALLYPNRECCNKLFSLSRLTSLNRRTAP